MQNKNAISRRAQFEDDPLAIIDSEESYYSDDYYVPAKGGSEKQQLFRVWSILKKHWLLIAGITLVGTSLVIVYEAQKPDYYTADVRIQVNNEINPAAGDAQSSI